MTISMMRTKDGFQECPRCKGDGCYHCDKKGFILCCPACANTDLFEPVDKDYQCLVCSTVFNRQGEVQPALEEDTDKKKESGPKKGS